MRIQAEEKVIYEKRTLSSLTESERSAMPLEQTSNIFDEVNGYVGILEQNRVNSSYRPLFSARKTLAGFVVFVKRVIRRLMLWYVEPVCQQQTTFNNAVTLSIGCVIEQLNELREENKQLHIAKSELLSKTQAALKELEARVESDSKEVQAKLREDFEISIRAERELSEKKCSEFEDILKIKSEQIIDFQNKMDCLGKLDLNIFSDEGRDTWSTDTQRIGTFSQCGEDMIILFLLRVLEIPFEQVTYIDLGANHAKLISNTYHFYRQGGRGILVEANPALIPELKFYRNGDLILNRCVSTVSGRKVDFYIMGDTYENGDGLSTAVEFEAMAYCEKNSNLKIHNVISVETISINDIVENYLGKTPTILNIDIEGNELDILMSMDFQVIRPFIIVVEMISYTFPFVVTERNPKIQKFLTDANYLEYAFTGVNSIFLDRVQLEERKKLR